MKRVRIDKNIEKSTVAGSTPITNASNELNYVAPGTLGQQLEINASGVPEYKSTLTDFITDSIENSINLNTVTPAFTPLDILEPTTIEVENWVNINLSGIQKINGTVLTYYIPVHYEFLPYFQVNFSNYGTTGTIDTFKVNGVNILSTPIDITTPNYWLGLITLFDNYILSIGKIGNSYDDGNPIENSYFPFDALNFVCQVEIGYTLDGNSGSDTKTNATFTLPAIGTEKEPTHVWVLDNQGITKMSSNQPFLKKGNDVSTSLTETKNTDSIYRLGKLNLFSDFNDFPENNFTPFQVNGNQWLNGRIKANKGIYSETPNLNLTVDVVNGNDNLDIMQYPQSSFKSLTKAIEFGNKYITGFVYIDVINTSLSNKAVLGGFNVITNRNFGIGNNSGIVQYIDCVGSIYAFNSTINFTKLNFTYGNNTTTHLFNSSFITNSTNIYLSPNQLNGTIYLRMNSAFQLHDSSGGSSIIATANNQAVFNNYAGEINQFLIDGGASSINLNGFTGMKLFAGNSTDFTAIVKIENGASLPTALNIQKCIIYQNGSVYIPTTNSYLKVGNSTGGNNSNYAQSAGGKVGMLANNQNWIGANGDVYFSANVDFDTFVNGFTSILIKNSSKNVLIKKLTDSGLGDLQVPIISLGDNKWHYSEDGQARFYFSNNSHTYFRVPLINAFVVRHDTKDTLNVYKNSLSIKEDGLFDISFNPDTLPLSNTINSFIIRKESNNQDFKIFSYNGTSTIEWFNIFTQSNRLMLGTTINIVNNNVGIGTATPNSFTILDVVSTTKGSRPFPSMTQAQRTALNASTPVGTHVYQTDGTEGVYVKKSGGTWVFAY